MKIIYEQGDVVYNKNNYTYGIVISEFGEQVKILECGGNDIFINCPPKSAIQYCGHTDLKKRLQGILANFVEQDHPTEKGGEG
jgi:hypothetical protein